MFNFVYLCELVVSPKGERRAGSSRHIPLYIIVAFESKGCLPFNCQKSHMAVQIVKDLSFSHTNVTRLKPSEDRLWELPNNYPEYRMKKAGPGYKVLKGVWNLQSSTLLSILL